MSSDKKEQRPATTCNICHSYFTFMCHSKLINALYKKNDYKLVLCVTYNKRNINTTFILYVNHVFLYLRFFVYILCYTGKHVNIVANWDILQFRTITSIRKIQRLLLAMTKFIILNYTNKRLTL